MTQRLLDRVVAVLDRRLDEAQLLAELGRAGLDVDRPLVANLIVTRRCNLSCGYCFEYDKVSPPVPLATLERRIDHLARLGTVIVTLTGGEALLHPDIVAVVRAIRQRGMTPVMNSNAYLLSRDLVIALDHAGLFAMQISIDNVHPDQTSKKSLKVLRPKLALLAAHARFRVRINTVLGASAPGEALEVARAALAFGFDAKCSLMRDASGAPLPLSAEAREVYRQIRELGRRAPRILSEDFQQSLLRDGTVQWKCRAGARFFHVCEDGLVHLCAPKHGLPGIPLEDYDVDDIRRAFAAEKPCTAHCPVAYAHQASQLDRFRGQAPDPTLWSSSPRNGDRHRNLRFLPVVA